MKKTDKAALGATGIGAGVGAIVGSGIGIAGAFGAISGVLPVAALGAYLGYKAYRGISKTGVGKDFGEGLKSGFIEKDAELREKRLANRGKSLPKE